MKWSDTTTYAFVKEYLKHSILYDPKCSNYRFKSLRIDALRKICAVTNLPNFGVKEAVGKIKSIRSTYSQEIKKINDSGGVYTPTLKWFPIYHEVMKDKMAMLNNKNYWNTDESEYVAEKEMIGSIDTSKRNLPVEDSKSTLTNKRKAVSPDKMPRMKTEGAKKSPRDDNEFELFGKSVAAQLKVMPLVLSLQAQAKIQSYLTNLRIQALTTPSNTNIIPSVESKEDQKGPNKTTIVLDPDNHAMCLNVTLENGDGSSDQMTIKSESVILFEEQPDDNDDDHL